MPEKMVKALQALSKKVELPKEPKGTQRNITEKQDNGE